MRPEVCFFPASLGHDYRPVFVLLGLWSTTRTVSSHIPSMPAVRNSVCVWGRAKVRGAAAVAVGAAVRC